MKNPSPVRFIFACSLVFAASPASAVTWDSSTAGDWDTTANWDLGSVPNYTSSGNIANVDLAMTKTDGGWTLFQYTGGLTDNGLELGVLPTLDSGYSWQLASGSNKVTLSIVPEPSAALLGGLDLLALLRRR